MKIVALSFILLFCASQMFSQGFILEQDHSTLQVKDLDKSAAFYMNILHFEELGTPWPNNPMIRFLKIGAHQQLHLAQVNFGDVKINKVLHLAFAVNDFDNYLVFLIEKGISYTNFGEELMKIQTRPDGVRQIYFKDPDGYWIEINDAKQ